MRPVWLRRACGIQLCMLVFALPYEYYFGSRDQSLYTSLKLQVLLLASTWTYASLVGLAGPGWGILERVKRIVPGRVMLACAVFVGVQGLAAALAPEFRANAIKAAMKAGLGALFSLIVVDLLASPRSPSNGETSADLHPLWALSLSGTCLAVLGLGAIAGNGFLARVVHVFQPSEYLLGDRVRFTSTMEYPNTAGSFLSVSLCASLALAVHPGTSRRLALKWVWSAMMALQALALTLTYSRGALVSTIVAIAATIWILRSHIFASQRKLVLAVCLAVFSVAVAVQFLARSKIENGGALSARRAARYALDTGSEIKFLLPGHTYRQIITVENDAPFHWRGGEYGIAYRWHSLSNNQNSMLHTGGGFLADVAPGQVAQVPISLTTPTQEGEYLLIWFVFGGSDDIQEVRNSYAPAVLCVIVPAGAEKGLSEKAGRYLQAIRKERQDPDNLLVPGRSELRTAALRMLRQRPLLGMGPDNFRLMKWKFMDAPKGDETILANSLYLELLSGSGILGLACFLWLIWEFGRLGVASVSSGRPRAGGALPFFGVAYLAGLLSHGFVDYFLKFTPTFLLFWLTLGMMLANREIAPWSGDADRV